MKLVVIMRLITITNINEIGGNNEIRNLVS